MIFFLIASSVAILIISVGMLIFVAYFFRAKRIAMLKEQASKLNYEQALSNTKTEVQANTLGYISRELHDNVNQLVCVAKMSTNRLKKEIDSPQLSELDNILIQIASEVRHISKSLEVQAEANFRLLVALKNDKDRIEKMGLIKFSTHLSGYTQNLSKDQEVILFRIIQEFVANTLKHSKATEIVLNLNSTDTSVRLSIADNGIGYTTTTENSSGSGLTNMTERANMLGASIYTTSIINKGTSLTISIPITQNKTS